MRAWLVAIRKDAKRTQRDVANAAGISLTYYKGVEQGIRGNLLSVPVAKKIATALGFDWTRFYDEDGSGEEGAWWELKNSKCPLSYPQNGCKIRGRCSQGDEDCRPIICAYFCGQTDKLDEIVSAYQSEQESYWNWTMAEYYRQASEWAAKETDGK